MNIFLKFLQPLPQTTCICWENPDNTCEKPGLDKLVGWKYQPSRLNLGGGTPAAVVTLGCTFASNRHPRRNLIRPHSCLFGRKIKTLAREKGPCSGYMRPLECWVSLLTRMVGSRDLRNSMMDNTMSWNGKFLHSCCWVEDTPAEADRGYLLTLPGQLSIHLVQHSNSMSRPQAQSSDCQFLPYYLQDCIPTQQFASLLTNLPPATSTFTLPQADHSVTLSAPTKVHI